MKALLALFGHPAVLTATGFSFLHWYFVEEPQRIVRRIWEYLQAFMEIFSFVFLVRTLFSPWKAITDEYPQKGFNLEHILETLTLNVTSRVIGFIFRIVVFVFGVGVVAAFCIVSVLFFFAWILFPILPFALPPFLFS